MRMSVPASSAGQANIRLCNPATFFMTSVCRRRGFRNRSAAIRHTFIFPIPCSTTIRRRDTRRFPALHRAVTVPLGGRRVGVSGPVATDPVSPVRGTPGGAITRARSYTF